MRHLRGNITSALVAASGHDTEFGKLQLLSNTAAALAVVDTTTTATTTPSLILA